MQLMNDNDIELTPTTKINYNDKDKRWYAQRIEWHKNRKLNSEGIFIILQWFMYKRNYGVVKYKGRVYNLNLELDALEMLYLLEREGFLVTFEEHRESINWPHSKEVIVLHPKYQFLGKIWVYHLWVNLIDNYFKQLTSEEIIEYNKQHQPPK
jgi:hypothetical protein